LKGWPIALGSAVLLALFSWLLLALWPYPELGAFLSSGYSTRVVDRRGELVEIVPLPGGVRREHTPLDRIPATLREAFVAAEDRHFFGHPGVDPLAIVRAARQNRAGQRTVSGASTITMQLARMIRRRGNGMQAKMGEAWDALRLEARFSKRRILELYLDHIPFGSQVEGVTSAARLFFGRPLSELRPEEAILLTVIPRRPALYDPRANPERATEAGFRLSEESGLGQRWNLPRTREAFAERVRIASSDDGVQRAPHFVRFLLRRHPELVGRSEVVTTMDLRLQEKLDVEIRNQVWAYAAQRMTNGAGVVLDNRTGDLLAYVGSADYADVENEGQNDGVQATNQPGSCLKPFLYALALERGFSPTTILPDIAQDFGGAEVYVPVNFNRRFNGPVRLRVALASSLNVPAVYTLQRLGVQAFADFLLAAGFSSIESQRESLGVGLALGNAEVSLWELARGFAIFPRGGIPLSIRMLDGEPVSRGAERIVSPYTAAEICRILSDQPSRFLGFGSARTMNTDYAAMFKTGTANQFQHVWALGATPEYTVGIWMGNFSGETIIGKTGSGIPARVAADMLAGIAHGGSAFPVPPDSRTVTVCVLSGGLATDACPAVVQETVPSTAEIAPCTYHRRTARGIETVYPPEYAAWLRDGRKEGSTEDEAVDGGIEVLQPANDAVFFWDPSIPASQQAISLEVAGRPEEDLEIWINGRPWGPLPRSGSAILPLRRGDFVVDIRGGTRIWGEVRFEVR
jgi:penicillin-binding protein 1C